MNLEGGDFDLSLRLAGLILPPCDVWASNDFLSVGIFQTEKSSAKCKQKRTITSSSQNMSNNMDSMALPKVTLVTNVNFDDMGK